MSNTHFIFFKYFIIFFNNFLIKSVYLFLLFYFYIITEIDTKNDSFCEVFKIDSDFFTLQVNLNSLLYVKCVDRTRFNLF